MYAAALKGRRNKMQLGFSAYQDEIRTAKWRPFKKLQESLDKWMRTGGLDYGDVWRITMLSKSSRHTQAEVDECKKALNWANQSHRDDRQYR